MALIPFNPLFCWNIDDVESTELDLCRKITFTNTLASRRVQITPDILFASSRILPRGDEFLTVLLDLGTPRQPCQHRENILSDLLLKPFYLSHSQFLSFP